MAPMENIDASSAPERLTRKDSSHFESTPPLHFIPDPAWQVPDEAACRALWDKYTMLGNIREHSEKVASIALFLAKHGAAAGINVCVGSVYASAMLHDIAKSYCITHGGNHSQLGAGIVMDELDNPYIAQGVLHHVHWPWHVDIEQWFLPLAIIYADKRVMHDTIVSLTERFDDLVVRYGKTDHIIKRIEETHYQAEAIESAFSSRLGIELHAYTFDSGRMV